MDDLDAMRLALDHARRAAAAGEVPVGCVITGPDGRVLSDGVNSRQGLKDPTGHAEITAIRAAAVALGDWRLEKCCLYVTLEPCAMCAGAIVNARIPRLVYGCPDPKAGCVRTLYQLCEDTRLNHRVEVTPGVLADEAAQLLGEFFRRKRAAGHK